MGIINKKGKIFGIINVIDLAVIVLLALVVGGGISRFKRTAPQVIAQSQKAIVEVQISEVRQATVDAANVGDNVYHYDRGQLFGTIVDKKVENIQREVETSDGNIVLAEVPERYNVLLYIEADATDFTDNISIGGEQIRVGAQYRLKNKSIAVFTTVLNVEFKDEK